MSTLAEPQTCARCLDRIGLLTPTTPAKWGRMNAHQMVCHLNDSFLVGTGERKASPATSAVQRTVIKWIALHSPITWPKGTPTRPEVDQERGGTPPGNWKQDCDRLRKHLKDFPRRQTFGYHPIFGDMTPAEWLIWGYRHVDHHLRQFGV